MATKEKSDVLIEKPSSGKCRCGGTLSMVNVMISENISISEFINVDLSNKEVEKHLNAQLDTPSSYTCLELRCNGENCLSPVPVDQDLLLYLDLYGYNIDNQ